MAADLKNLLLRGRTYSVRIVIPKRLRPYFQGRTKVVLALGTGDLREAQRLRHAHLAEWNARFARVTVPRPMPLTNATAAAFAIEEDLADGIVPPAIAEQIETLGVGAALAPGTAAYAELARALSRRTIAAINSPLPVARTVADTAPAAYVAPVKVANGSNGSHMTFSAACAGFLDEHGRDLSTGVVGAHKLIWRLFTDFAGDLPLDEVDRGKAFDFLTTLRRLNPNWGRRKTDRALPLAELLARFGDQGAKPSAATTNKHVNSMSVVFKWAIRRGKFTPPNPFSCQRFAVNKDETDAAVPFTDAELRKMFAPWSWETPTEHSLASAVQWAARLALYTGMRTAEVAQLRADDVRKIEGVWCVRVTDAGEGQSVKTEAAVRSVPLHSAIRADVLRYRDAPPDDGQLFPALKPDAQGKRSPTLSRAFSRYLERVGVTGDGKRFYSFRKTFATAAHNAGIELEPFLGHSEGFSKDTYSSGLTVARLAELIEQIQFSV